MKTCPECSKTLSNQNNKFCNKSCAAKHTNKNRTYKPSPKGECKTCAAPIPTRKTWCSDKCKNTCTVCNNTLSEDNIYTNSFSNRRQCKTCFNKTSSQRVIESRRNKKKKLVESHGSQCVDCGIQGPSYIYDFDHREPENKSFGIAESMNKLSFHDLYQETLKCDLVCSLCHRYRTHLQRCSGCDDCRKEIVQGV